MISGKDLYFVAVKLFLRDVDKLLISHDVYGAWDLPGGRIKPDEFDVPLQDIIARKMREELGENLRYELEDPRIFFRVKRIEQSTDTEVKIFAIGYEANYLGGDIHLGQSHDTFEWVDIRTFKPGDYFEGGWLKGVEEYLKIDRAAQE